MQPVCELWRRCVDEPANSAAWQDYLVAVRPLILGIARRIALVRGVREQADIEDIFQEICLKISRQSGSIPASVFESNGSAEAYLRTIAGNAARDAMRTLFAGKRGAHLTAPIEDHERSLESVGAEAIDLGVLFREIQELLDGSDRDRAVFLLYYRQGFTAREIALIPAVGLSRKGVESLILRMTAAVRARMLERHPTARAAAAQPKR